MFFEAGVLFAFMPSQPQNFCVGSERLSWKCDDNKNGIACLKHFSLTNYLHIHPLFCEGLFLHFLREL